jgi:hypothetical protein
MLVQDNALDNTLYDQVLADNLFFPNSMGLGEKISERINQYDDKNDPCFSPYMFWDGWWKSPADTLKKRVIQKIWENNLQYPVEDIAGIEYWTRTFHINQYHDTHVDMDTFLYQKEKIFQGALCSSVYYGLDNKEGGFLEIHNKFIKDGSYEVLEKNNFINYKATIDERERIAYKGNRLVIMDGGHNVHNTTPPKSGIRQVLATNVWHKDRPPSGLILGTFHYE